jgi:hypothetical protein
MYLTTSVQTWDAMQGVMMAADQLAVLCMRKSVVRFVVSWEIEVRTSMSK